MTLSNSDRQAAIDDTVTRVPADRPLRTLSCAKRTSRIRLLEQENEVLRHAAAYLGKAATGHPHDIVTELLRIRLRHGDILPAHPSGKPARLSPQPRQSPPSIRKRCSPCQQPLNLILLPR